ncbi:sulfite exporter TauE/SafE family protein [Nocardioides gilvus]|uniref:sulfite exporter TauE/SafE family protein n=1 Tax=Nocardioides gilvus TaxID=1735589 RepID=UPI000D74F893|nr:sulfite exporter TauE/SafE family protein [Nocardioides gilvus]
MSALEGVVILIAGIAAGTINTIVGSGTLITFPTLLAFGVPPITANASNTIGLVPGAISGAVGYRRELVGQRDRVVRLLSASVLGGAAGAVLLLALPESAFATIVPALILLGIVLVVTGPRISRLVAARHEATGGVPAHGAWWVWPAIGLAGVYGGYFGAAQGVLLMAILGIGVQESLQRLNGVKNILGAAVNGVSGLIFVFVAEVDWRVVALIAVGSVIGGQIGAGVGRRLPDLWLRTAIVVVGVSALVFFLRS